jgi:succinyl-CoA synthetase alpha subunit
MGHAGAIIDGTGAGHAAKCAALEQAGVRVAAIPGEVPALVRAALTSAEGEGS